MCVSLCSAGSAQTGQPLLYLVVVLHLELGHSRHRIQTAIRVAICWRWGPLAPVCPRNRRSVIMPVKIRLARFGCRHSPQYHIRVANSWARRDGRFIEKLGEYSPFPDAEGVKRVALDFERTKYWLSVGAQPTDTVAWLFGKVPPSITAAIHTLCRLVFCRRFREAQLGPWPIPNRASHRRGRLSLNKRLSVASGLNATTMIHTAMIHKSIWHN